MNKSSEAAQQAPPELSAAEPPDEVSSSECVGEGHPDKACDRISDAILDWLLRRDPNARVGIEVGLKASEEDAVCFIIGEVTTTFEFTAADLERVARQQLVAIGYKDEYDLPLRTMRFDIVVSKQSPDIAQGVDEGAGLHTEQGAGDQGMMFGYATSESAALVTNEFPATRAERLGSCMPLSLELARRITTALGIARRKRVVPWLRSDCKAQVTVQSRDGVVIGIPTILVSVQNVGAPSQEFVRDWVINNIIKPAVPAALFNTIETFHVNPTGAFTIGGPRGDAGLTGRKIIVDTYGGHGAHGGGAFSGKDPSKVDRSAAYMARAIAKNLVLAGACDRCLVQLAYVIGVAEPVSINVKTDGTGIVSNAELAEIVRKVFPLKPAGIIAALDLKRPIYANTASYGHFGIPGLPWEEYNRVNEIRGLIPNCRD